MDFEVIILTPEQDFPQEIRWVNRLFGEGLTTFHVRKPGSSLSDLVRYLRGVEDQYYSRIMVHYHEEVANEIPLKGVHYRFAQLPQQKPGHKVSCGCHSWQEFQEVEKRVDYAFVSPFFNSISKKGYEANKELWEVPGEVNTKKAIALGGIRQENILQIRELKVKGAAVLGAIWETSDPVKAYKELKTRIIESRKS